MSKKQDEKDFFEEIKKEVTPFVAFIIIVILLFALLAIVNFINFLSQNPWAAYIVLGILTVIGFLYFREKLGIAWPFGAKLPMDSYLIEKLPSPVQKILQQVSGCYRHRLYESSSVMMRKCLDTAITLRFRMDSREKELLGPTGEPFDLPKKIELAKQSRYITASIASKLSQLKWVGDIGAHDYKVNVKKEDVEEDYRTLRIALEHMYG